MSEACYCDFDVTPSLYVRETRRARKQHRCSECKADIEPGEQYEHTRGVWDGDPSTYRACCRCIALRDWVQAHIPCLCWAHGSMIEDSLGELDMRDRAEAPGFYFGAMRRAVAIRRHWRACRERRNAA